jgi:hypothetical protein
MGGYHSHEGGAASPWATTLIWRADFHVGPHNQETRPPCLRPHWPWGQPAAGRSVSVARRNHRSILSNRQIAKYAKGADDPQDQLAPPPYGGGYDGGGYRGTESVAADVSRRIIRPGPPSPPPYGGGYDGGGYQGTESVAADVSRRIIRPGPPSPPPYGGGYHDGGYGAAGGGRYGSWRSGASKDIWG